MRSGPRGNGQNASNGVGRLGRLWGHHAEQTVNGKGLSRVQILLTRLGHTHHTKNTHKQSAAEKNKSENKKLPNFTVAWVGRRRSGNTDRFQTVRNGLDSRQ